jgi:ABC-type amino acid transport substrate-binding protein
MADVFISYSKSSRDLTIDLANYLQSSGFSVWWDDRIISGDSYRKVINKQLDLCKAAVIIWTRTSVESLWVIAEANRALKQNKLVSVHLPDLPQDRIPMPFGELQTVPLANRGAILAAIKTRIEDGKQQNSEVIIDDTLLDDKKRTMPRHVSSTIISWIAALGLTVTFGIIGVLKWPSISHFMLSHDLRPEWTVKGEVFIHQDLPLTWNYGQTSNADAQNNPSMSSTQFEIWSASDDKFREGARFETYADGNGKHVHKVNGTRFWRLRAVDRESKQPISLWSNPILLTQYETAYDRIKNTGRVLVYMSNAETQGEFRFVDRNGDSRGFDYELARLIVEELSSSMNRTLIFPKPRTVPWQQLLDVPQQGRGDIIISSISKNDKRRKKFQLDFSETYYCTTYSLIYLKTNTSTAGIREMVAGSLIGAQRGTTNADVARKVAENAEAQVSLYSTTEELADALLHSEIKYGIIDTPFAILANVQNRFDFKEFQTTDFPMSVPRDEQVQEYAVGVLSGESDLLRVINDTIIHSRKNGSIARLLRLAMEEYGTQREMAPDKRPNTNPQPWQCFK